MDALLDSNQVMKSTINLKHRLPRSGTMSSAGYEVKFLFSLIATGGIAGCAEVPTSQTELRSVPSQQFWSTSVKSIELNGGNIIFQAVERSPQKDNAEEEIEALVNKVVASQVNVEDKLVVMLSQGMTEFYD